MVIDYEAYRRSLLAQGASEEQADRSIEEMRAIESELDRCICPECAGRLFRTMSIEDDGIFAIYTCSVCNAFCACRPEAGLGAA